MVPWGTGNPISPGYLNTLVFLTGKPSPLSVSVGGGSMSPLAFTKKQAEKTSGKNKRKEHAGKTQASKTLANKDRIVSYIQMQNGAGTSEIATQIELSDARTRVLLAELISEGRIYLEGNGRARRYYVPMKS